MFKELRKILYDNVDIFRTELSEGPPAQAPPMHIELPPDARTVRVKLCNYSQEQREFMNNIISNLVSCDMAYFSPTSPWACAPLLILKPTPAKFRGTVNLLSGNKYTVRHQFWKPYLEHELSDLSGCKYFATYDLSHGYCQFELDQELQALQSFIMPDGIYSTTRVMHGTTNAVTYLQSACVGIVPGSLKRLLKHWLDDALMYAKSLEELFSTILLFFEMFKQHNIKLHPRKCLLFKKEGTRCGLKISREGVRFDPRRLDALLKMEPPMTASNFQQFLSALQWLKNTILSFSELV